MSSISGMRWRCRQQVMLWQCLTTVGWSCLSLIARAEPGADAVLSGIAGPPDVHIDEWLGKETNGKKLTSTNSPNVGAELNIDERFEQ